MEQQAEQPASRGQGARPTETGREQKYRGVAATWLVLASAAIPVTVWARGYEQLSAAPGRDLALYGIAYIFLAVLAVPVLVPTAVLAISTLFKQTAVPARVLIAFATYQAAATAAALAWMTPWGFDRNVTEASRSTSVTMSVVALLTCLLAPAVAVWYARTERAAAARSSSEPTDASTSPAG